MKKLILLILIVVAGTTLIKAQGIQLGIKAGANMNKISGVSFNNAYNLNYLLGAFVAFNFSKNVGIEPELEFSQSSATTSYTFNDTYRNLGPAITNNPHLDYMSIPILLNIGGSILKFQVGPQYSILMNGNESLWENGQQAFKGGDIALDGGILLTLPFHIDLSARYVQGLQNINNVNSNDAWRNQEIQLSVGLRL